MDRDANYVAVGAFVLLVIAMAASFVFWYTEQQDKRTYVRYEIYFEGTVSGLTAGSPVRYLGVDVGKVVRILLDPQQRRRVQVIADIDSSAPIDQGTKASLSLQGITGLLFIDLQHDQKSTASGPLPQGQQYPVIRSVPSDFDVLLSSLPALATHAIVLVDHLTQVFSDDNVRAIHASLENTRLATERLPDTVKDIQALVADLRLASHEVQLAASGLHGIENKATPDLEAALSNVRRVTESLASTSDNLNRLVNDNEPGISRFTSQSLPEFEQLLRESRSAASDFRDLSRSLKANPSQLLYESPYRGVEVPKVRRGTAGRGTRLRRPHCCVAVRGAGVRDGGDPDGMYRLAFSEQGGRANRLSSVREFATGAGIGRAGGPRHTAPAHSQGSRLGSDCRALSRSASGYFADARWSGPLDEVLQDLALQAFRSGAGLRNVSADASAFASGYWLESTSRISRPNTRPRPRHRRFTCICPRGSAPRAIGELLPPTMPTPRSRRLTIV